MELGPAVLLRGHTAEIPQASLWLAVVDRSIQHFLQDTAAVEASPAVVTLAGSDSAVAVDHLRQRDSHSPFHNIVMDSTSSINTDWDIQIPATVGNTHFRISSSSPQLYNAIKPQSEVLHQGNLLPPYDSRGTRDAGAAGAICGELLLNDVCLESYYPL